MKRTVLILCIMFAASSVFAQEYRMMGDRIISAPAGTSENKPAQEFSPFEKKEKNADAQEQQSSEPNRGATGQYGMMGERSYSAPAVVEKDATPRMKPSSQPEGSTAKSNVNAPMTNAGSAPQNYMMGDRSISSLPQVYAQSGNAEISRNGADTSAGGATGEPQLAETPTATDNMTVSDNATAPIETTDNATSPANADISTEDNTTTKKTSWLDGIFNTEKTDQKFFVTINYSWFSPQNSETRDFLKNAFGLSVGYNINKYFGAELGFYSKNGKQSSSITDNTGITISAKTKIDSFDIFAMATARYPFRVWKGDLMPYVGAGAGFASGTKKDEVNINGIVAETSKNATGFSLIGRVGVRYGIGMFIIGANAQYIYNNMDYDKKYDFSSITYGIEAGLRF